MPPRLRAEGVPVDPARVREARLEAGLSLAQLAGDDVSRTFIHFVEHGRSRPSKRVLALIARRTGKPISYFLPPASPGMQPGDELEVELTRVASRLSRAASVNTNKLDRETLRQIELTIRQGVELIRMMRLRVSGS
jgi:transcriptional regulator with XRE-family HTH domain